MNKVFPIAAVVLFVLCAVFVFNIVFDDYQGYARCPQCNAAFQLRFGLPGQHNLSTCHFCGGGPLVRCSKEESGWRDDWPKSAWKYGR